MMKQHKKQTGIRNLVYANLGLICLVSCSTTFQLRPKKDSIKNAAIVPVAPAWLEKIKKNVDNFHSADLFPKESLNYTPPRQVVKKQIISANYDIRKESGVTAAQLNRVFKGKLKNKGESIINISRKYKIDPLFIASLACHESAFGTSSYSYKANNVTGQLYKDKKTGKWNPIQFKNVEECLERTCRSIRDNYIAAGRTNINLVQQRYCPVISNKKSKDFNDSGNINIFWTKKIVEHMKKIVSVPS
jgi:beta-N-acetylglucosaminidase